jgi:hypothetical protein
MASLINGLVLPRGKVAGEWRRKIWVASIDRDMSIDTKGTALLHIIAGYVAAGKLVGGDLAAAYSYQLATDTAAPGRIGRPPGPSTNDQINDLSTMTTRARVRRRRRRKITREWCRNIRMASIAQGMSVDTEQAALGSIIIGYIAASKLVGDDMAAVYLYELARDTASLDLGRLPGLDSHDLDQLNDLKLLVLMREDGSDTGRSSAITVAIENELSRHRPKLRLWLRRHLPPLGAKNTTEKTPH